jgi:uncharacterized Zn finger protein (UPF0148 family)
MSELNTCSECGNPVRLKKHKPYCDRCGYLTANGRKVLAPSPSQIEEAKLELRKCPVSSED